MKNDFSNKLLTGLSFIAIITGFIGLCYSIGDSLFSSGGSVILDYSPDIKKGSKWTNGNSRVVVNKVYGDKVIYTRINDRGRYLDTCSLSKRVFRSRYFQLFDFDIDCL